MNKPVTAPMLYVKTKGQAGGYCANHIATVIHNGRYCLQFISSGFLTVLPVDDILSIELAVHGAQHCVACDAPLSAWPIDDPSYGPSNG